MDMLIGLLAGVFMAAFANWMVGFWRCSRSAQRRHEARAVLKKHALTPQLYLATMGVEDEQLRRALDAFAFSGYIITDANRAAIGRLCPTVKRALHLRLVVSND